jgi:periplasmic protein TonB
MEKKLENEPTPRNVQERELDEAERWIEGDPRERKVIVWAFGIAVALHAAVLFARLPDWGPEPVRVDAPEMAMKVQFLEPPPPAPPKQPEPPKPKTEKIPRPDLTPDEPEPETAPEPAPAPDVPLTPAPAPVQTGPVRVSPGQGPGLIKRVEPIYPPPARAARMEGTVILDAVILKDGSVSDVTVVKSANPLFDRAAMDALRKWRFTPGNQDVIMSLTVHFVLKN